MFLLSKNETNKNGRQSFTRTNTSTSLFIQKCCHCVCCVFITSKRKFKRESSNKLLEMTFSGESSDGAAKMCNHFVLNATFFLHYFKSKKQNNVLSIHLFGPFRAVFFVFPALLLLIFFDSDFFGFCIVNHL